MESIDAKWTRLSSLALRVVLTRKDISYADLAQALTKRGLKESARSVEGKIQRGAFSFAFFIECLEAAQADWPPIWGQYAGKPATEIARAILHDAMSNGAKLDYEELSRRLRHIGLSASSHALSTDILTGNYSFRLLLQCAVVIPITEVSLFVDLSDLRAAASSSVGASPAAELDTTNST